MFSHLPNWTPLFSNSHIQTSKGRLQQIYFRKTFNPCWHKNTSSYWLILLPWLCYVILSQKHTIEKLNTCLHADSPFLSLSTPVPQDIVGLPSHFPLPDFFFFPLRKQKRDWQRAEELYLPSFKSIRDFYPRCRKTSFNTFLL